MELGTGKEDHLFKRGREAGEVVRRGFPRGKYCSMKNLPRKE